MRDSTIHMSFLRTKLVSLWDSQSYTHPFTATQ